MTDDSQPKSRATVNEAGRGSVTYAPMWPVNRFVSGDDSFPDLDTEESAVGVSLNATQLKAARSTAKQQGITLVKHTTDGDGNVSSEALEEDTDA